MHTNNFRSLAYLSAGAGAEPVEQIEAAAAAGLDGVGLRTVAPIGLALVHPIVGNKAKIDEIRRATGRTGVRIFDCEVLTLTADTKIADITPALAAVAEIGCSKMQITSEDADRSRALDNFGLVCDEANRFGIRMAFEFMQWRAVKTIEDCAGLVSEAARSNGGIVLDTLHLSRSGGTPANVAKVPAEKLFYVQLCDAVANKPATDQGLINEARGSRLYPGEGTLWLDELFDLLPDNLPISIEVPPAPSAKTVAERARIAADKLDAWLSRYRAASSR